MGVDEHPWSARRNRFLALPRGPAEWGRLLYEPDWSRRFFLQELQAVFVPPMVLALLWIIVGDVVRGNVIPGRENYAAMFVAMTVGAALLCFYLVTLELRRMPFRVYETGFTLERVPFALGLHRRGVLVPAERITSVTLRRRRSDTGDQYSVVVGYTGEDGATRSLEVRPDDPLTALQALARIAPERMGDDVKALLDPRGAIDEVVEEEGEARFDRSSILVPLIMWSSTAAFLAMPLLMVPHMMEEGRVDLLPVGVALTMVLLLSAMGWYTVLSAYSSLFAGHNVVAGSEGLEVRVPLPLRLQMRAPGVLPYGMIGRARRCPSPGSLRSTYQMLAGTSRPISISGETFRELARRPEFRREGFDLVNTVEPPQGPRRLARPNIPGIVAIVAAATVVSLLIFTVTGLMEDGGGTDGGGDEPPGELTLFDKLFFFGSLSFMMGFGSIMFLRLHRRRRMEQRAEGVEVDGGSIRLPHAGAPFEEVERSEVVTIVGRRLLTFARPVLVVETKKGRLLLPVYLVDDLREHGYVVELPERLEGRGKGRAG